MAENRILSGMRPSGRLHLGNYFGALKNWVKLQDEYECMYMVADVHALTTLAGSDQVSTIANDTHEMVLDWLAAGLNPEKCVLFIQSQVPEHLILSSLLSMSTPLGWLLRVPTFKERVRQLGEDEEHLPYGLVGYPVLQTADVIVYKANKVPVGIDQVPHIEISREIVRRFNRLYGETFPEPQPLLTESPMIYGTDGESKMSKSLNNHVELAASEEQTSSKVRTMVTDPQRLRLTDPGRPEVCNVYSLQKIFNNSQISNIHELCTTAGIGCVADKKNLSDGINSFFKEFRERRIKLEEKPEEIKEVLKAGAEKARKIATATIEEVYSKMGLA
ncbi:MAG: tryptophan--tRNA ligase [Chloroflexi bacterium]|nr:tryptophan--tRNA ligase [Chloroflexota bacterium]|tara:strand:+ start:1155 stop:2150 length:996 start_codon:yes stop_codon:yes gene_type:complete